MTMQDAYQVKITLHLRAPNGHSSFLSTARGTLRDTHKMHVYLFERTRNARAMK